VLEVPAGRFEELLVFDVPDLSICPAGNICDELTETPLRIPLAQLRDGRQQICAWLAVHN
jgi:hypothetical protein